MTTITKGTVRPRKGAPAVPTPPPKSEVSILDTLAQTPGVPKFLRGAIFGPPKTSKTTLACSGENVLLINFDPDGAATQTLKGRKDVTLVEPTLMQFDQLIKELHTNLVGKFDWVVVDSLTFLFQLVGGKEINDTYVAGKDIRRAYGQAGAAVNQRIQDLVSAPVNVIFTAHLAKEHKDDDGTVDVQTDIGEHEVKLAITPMVWQILGPAVGFIGRTYKTKEYVKNAQGVLKPETKYKVSFNDGDRSPVGSRYSMDGEYEITLTTLKDMEAELRKETE